MTESNEIQEKKHRYVEPWEDSDMILIVEDENFHVHSNILSFASPVFKAMLSLDFKEGRDKVVNLPGKEKSTVWAMLNLLYPIEYQIMDHQWCRPLLELAREYEIKRFVQLIDDYICYQTSPSVTNLNLSEEFDLVKTRKVNIEYYSSIDSHLDDSWRTVSDKAKLEVLIGKIKAENYSPNNHNRTARDVLKSLLYNARYL